MAAAAGADKLGQSGRSDMKSIVLGDDHAVFVESLVSVLASHGFRVPAVARSLTGTIEAIRHHQPDVCLLARRFSDGDGVSAIGRINAVSPATRVLILAADRDAEAMRQAVRLGAAGYLHKTCGVRKLVQALLTKLGVHSRLEAATFAVRYDLVDHDQQGAESRTRTG